MVLRLNSDHAGPIFIGGPEPGIVTIAEYDPQWPTRFEHERARIGSALGERAKRIEHIGSTAVRGLAAKPIVDILVLVDDVEDDAAHVKLLETAGYVLRVKEPGHRMLRTVAKDVHVHLSDSAAEVERHVKFRDRLRANETGSWPKSRAASPPRALRTKRDASNVARDRERIRRLFRARRIDRY